MAAKLGPLVAALEVRTRRLAGRARESLDRASFLRKWLVLGALIGVVAGLGAIAFYELLRLASWFFLRLVAGYVVPTPAGEGGALGLSGFARPWVVPLVVGLGGLVSGLLVFRFAPDAEGHGTDAAIRAVHENPRGIRFRTVVVKLFASALTIGSGGSGGREGPTAQISAGFASLLTRQLNLAPADGRVAVAVGIGSGIGAIFRAPLGGAVLAAEILYRDDIEVEALLPGLIASVVAYALFGSFVGFTPLFGTVGGYRIGNPAGLLWFALIGVACGLVGLLYASGFYTVAGRFSSWRVPRALKPAIGGVIVGLLSLAMPQVLGTGYGWVQLGLTRQGLMHLSLAVVLVLPFAKILATACSIGSGGSGGIFGPGIVIGAFVGAGAWRLLEPFAPGVPHEPSAFVAVGMMACFGSIARAPLGVMLMVAEMTSSLAVLAPAMIAVGIATLIVRHADATIYRSQLRSRADSPAHRMVAGMPLLTQVTVAEAMTAPRAVARAGERASAVRARLGAAGVPGCPLTDASNVYLGTVAAADLERHDAPDADADGAQTVDESADSTAPTVDATATLDVAAEALADAGAGWVTVLDGGRLVTGIISSGDVVRGYRRALLRSGTRLSEASPDAVPFEVRIGPDAPSAGCAVRDAGLPHGAIVLTLSRGNSVIFVDGDTELVPGDTVTIVAPPTAVEDVRRRLEGSRDAA